MKRMALSPKMNKNHDNQKGKRKQTYTEWLTELTQFGISVGAFNESRAIY